MPRTLKNNDSLLNFFVGCVSFNFSPVWSEGQVVQKGPGYQASQGGPGGQGVRWSGGHDGQHVQGGPDGSYGPYGPGDQASQGGPGGQVVRVVRVVSLDDMLSQNIWFSCPKSSNN